MDNIRTSSLFHFTKEIGILKLLITNGIYPNYCKENLQYYNEQGEVITNVYGIPMVSFCDIPLSRSKDFRERYGNFAISLNKKWVKDNHNFINPVIYAKDINILRALYTIQNFTQITDNMIGSSGGSMDVDFSNPQSACQKMLLFINNNQLKDNTKSLFGYAKKYQNDKDDSRPDQINYIENEWRYIIPEGDGIEWFKSIKEYNDWRGDENTKKPDPTKELIKRKLSFFLDDISSIVVNSEDDVNTMIDFLVDLKTIGGNPIVPSKEIEHDEQKKIETAHLRLASKIISFEKIEADF